MSEASPYALLLLAALFSMSAVMLAAWLHQRAIRNAGVADIYWTFGTGVTAVVCALFPLNGAPGWRQVLVAAMVGLWSLRLGTYITVRVVRARREDARYQRMRQDWGHGFQGRLLWFLQVEAPVSVVLCLAVLLAAHNPSPGPAITDVLGVLIWLIAMGGEAVADRQLQRFKADPANAGRVCDTRLWAWSRHPNYFFEWLVWLSYPVIAFFGPCCWLAFAAPALMFVVLRYGSGVPPLEETMAASRGAAWAAYQRRTAVFFPRPPREVS